MIQGAFEAAVMYKMRDWRGEVKNNLEDILRKMQHILDENKDITDKNEISWQQEYQLISLAAAIGNMLED